jgi:hypothetical protein
MNKKISTGQISEENGWTKRFVASEPRLSEAVEAYHEAGFETRLEPLPKQAECETCGGDEDSSECRICFDGHEDEYKIIYTRPKSGSSAKDLCW